MQQDWNIILSVLESPEKSMVGQQKIFSNSPITVGRAENNDFILPDPSVSRNHAVIRITNDYSRVFISDSSTYGTVVSGKNVPKGPGSGFTLNNGENISFGNTMVRFELKLKQSVQSTMIVDNFERDIFEFPVEPDTSIEPESETYNGDITGSAENMYAISPLYMGVIIICILLIIYLIFFD